MLEGIGTFQCGLSNIPGLIKLEYLPTAGINKSIYQQLISSAWNWQIDVPLISGFGWLTMQAQARQDKQLWTENQTRDLQGKIFTQTVTAEIPNLLPAVSRTMDRTADYRFLLRITDKAGQKWILGTLANPFEFLSDGTTGTVGALKHHAIQFSAITKHKAYGFEPVL